MIAEVSPSTASTHLNRLKEELLVRVLVQGKHRYYSLERPDVGRALDGLIVLAGGGAAEIGAITERKAEEVRRSIERSGELCDMFRAFWSAFGPRAGSPSVPMLEPHNVRG